MAQQRNLGPAGDFHSYCVQVVAQTSPAGVSQPMFAFSQKKARNNHHVKSCSPVNQKRDVRFVVIILKKCLASLRAAQRVFNARQFSQSY